MIHGDYKGEYLLSLFLYVVPDRERATKFGGAEEEPSVFVRYNELNSN